MFDIISFLPKIHKPNVPLWPIVSSRESAKQTLVIYLVQQVYPYVEEIPSHLKNADHFLEFIKIRWRVSKSIDKTLQIIKWKYRSRERLHDEPTSTLLENCLFNLQPWEVQTNLEGQRLTIAICKPNIWIHFVDDTFVIHMIIWRAISKEFKPTTL